MRVLHVCAENPNRILGGRGVHIRHVLPALRAEGVDAFLLTLANETNLFDDRLEVCPVHDVFIRDAPVNFMQNNWAVYDTAIHSLKGPVDIVHAHDADLGLCAKALAKHFNAKLVTTVHLAIRRVLHGNVIPEHYAIQDMYEAALLASSNAAVFCSEYYAREVQQKIHRFDYKRFVVPNAVIPANRQPKRDKFTIFFAGRIADQKGIKIVIDAIKERPDLNWIVAGKVHAISKEEENKHPAWSELLKLQDQYPDTVHVAGHLENHEVLEIGSSCHAWVAPSLHAPFEIVGLEAMSAGTPLICTKTGGFLEYANESNALFIEPHPGALLQAVKRLQDDPALAQSLVENGTKTAEGFTWQNTAKMLKSVYENL